MAHVFISYVHQNQSIVDKLSKELKSRGVTVWLDRNDIEPGVRWQDAIKKAIEGGRFLSHVSQPNRTNVRRLI